MKKLTNGQVNEKENDKAQDVRRSVEVKKSSK